MRKRGEFGDDKTSELIGALQHKANTKWKERNWRKIDVGGRSGLGAEKKLFLVGQ